MKNLVMKLRKSEGYVGIETIVVAAVITAVGVIGYNVLFAGTLSGMVGDADATLDDNLLVGGPSVYAIS